MLFLLKQLQCFSRAPTRHTAKRKRREEDGVTAADGAMDSRIPDTKLRALYLLPEQQIEKFLPNGIRDYRLSHASGNTATPFWTRRGDVHSKAWLGSEDPRPSGAVPVRHRVRTSWNLANFASVPSSAWQPKAKRTVFEAGRNATRGVSGLEKPFAPQLPPRGDRGGGFQAGLFGFH